MFNGVLVPLMVKIKMKGRVKISFSPKKTNIMLRFFSKTTNSV